MTAARQVFLLEPALDPAVEQQAVARVHRIGQTGEVTITRLLVVDSVEEQVRWCVGVWVGVSVWWWWGGGGGAAGSWRAGS